MTAHDFARQLLALPDVATNIQEVHLLVRLPDGSLQDVPAAGNPHLAIPGAAPEMVVLSAPQPVLSVSVIYENEPGEQVVTSARVAEPGDS